jgi:hypothetical protein
MLNDYNFERFLQRAETGFDSRTTIIEEFIYDFNKSDLDWVTGRGIFGSFYSKNNGDKERDGQRNLIENGYLHIILKNGLLYLIPFILLSIIASILGFFYSKNLLSMASAVLIIVNLIDMIGYGIPFLGLKYLNLLIAFGFCFSQQIRSMSDSDLRVFLKI